MSGYMSPALVLVVTLLAARYLRKSTNETPGSIAQGVAHNSEQQNPNQAWFQDSLFAHEVGDRVSSLVFLADGRLVTISFHALLNKIRIWVPGNGQLKEMGRPFEYEGATVASIAASKDGKYIITNDKYSKVIILEDTKTCSFQKLGELKANGNIKALDVSPDSTRVAIGSDVGEVVIWSLLTQKCLLDPLSSGAFPVSSVKFSPAGDRLGITRHIVGRGNSSVDIWHSHTGARLGSVPIDQTTYSLAWSPDGRRLFIGGTYGSIKCFDITTQSFLSRWQVPFKDNISTLSVTHNGQYLVSASSRTSGIDIWDICDISLSTPIRVLSCNRARLFSISPDNSRLATIEDERKLRIWGLSSVKFSLSRRLSPLVREQEHFTYISNEVYDAWASGDLQRAEEILSNQIEEHAPDSLIGYLHANRALLRVRLNSRDGAIDDVNFAMSCGEPTPLIIYVAKGLAYQGEPGIGMETDPFDSALRFCSDDTKRFIQSIKSIAILDPPRFDVQIDNATDPLDKLVMARAHFLRARHYMDQGKPEDLRKVKELLDAIPDLGPLLPVTEVRTISLMFDWNLRGLISDIHELRCRTLYEIKPSHLSAMNYFSVGEKDISEEMAAVTTKLSLLSERFADEATAHGQHDEAIAWYTEALALTGCPSDVLDRRISMEDIGKDQATLRRLGSLRRNPNCIVRLFTRRSEAEARNGPWKDAKTDAEWAIQLDSSHIAGHHVKCKALHELERYEEACAALSVMSSLISDPQVDELNKCYLETLAEIDRITKRVMDESPFILIHVEDGRLCDQDEQQRRFKQHSTFYGLVSSMSQSMVLRTDKIEATVENYFRYVMLSHTWEKEEPLFHDVSGSSVYDTLIAEKYKKVSKFCETVRDDYETYLWAWNDTCCIDKTDPKKLDMSIKSMYNWYNNSALTLILLADPSDNPGSQPRGSLLLKDNRWMFRAWTLQELLAPKVIRFYSRTWQLYLGDDSDNHKESPDIISELAGATGITEDILAHFHPKELSVREKLRLASNRQATQRVDIAYSLIGIFKSDIAVDHAQPDAEVPLGLLLQEIVHRRGDVTVLDWSGESSKRFNSALPADISVYGQDPYKLPNINEVDSRIPPALPTQHILEIYNALTRVTKGSLTFQDRKLKLPCITISVTAVNLKSTVPGASLYIASTEALGTFEFSTKHAPSDWQQERIVLVYPWIYELDQKIEHSGGDEHTKALKVIAYLEDGFRALLFAKPLQSRRPVGYRRIAAEMQIDIRARELECWKGIAVELLEIWDH